MGPDALRARFTPVRTARLLLRAPVQADAGAVLAVEGDPQTNRFNPRAPLGSLDEARARLVRDIGWWRSDGFGHWAVSRLADEDAVIGFGGISRKHAHGREVLNLYYRFVPAVWGQGFAGEMAGEAVRLGRTHLPELPIIVRTRPGNGSALKLASRAGFTRRPDLDDEFSVLAIGWR